jgi:hypothetical protein
METRYIKRLIVLISSTLESENNVDSEKDVVVVSDSTANSILLNSIQSDRRFLLKAKKVFTIVLRQQIQTYAESQNRDELRIIRWIIMFCKNPALSVRQTQYVSLLPFIIAMMNNVED